VQASRYDSHADWFLDYSAQWTATSSQFLPSDLSGVRVLDLACGWGQLSRDLTGRGATVTGVELALPLLQRAQELERTTPQGITYLHGDASELDWWDDQPFDGAVCNMALMDIDDLDATLATMRAVLRPGGWFNLSLLHPCYPGEQHTGALSSWPPHAGYGTEGWWTTGSTGVRGHVGAIHRKLSTYLNAILAAGLTLTRLTEPDETLPRVLIIDGHRPQ
jgi:ubiquinone/menaquinone biosynthesis C-methylase UbiE